jgi:hypothetical protein
MRLYQNFVEGNADEINATRETLKFLGFATHQPAQPLPLNGDAASLSPTGLWDEDKARAFLKALDDEYPTSHKKVFGAMYKAGKISYEDLQKKVGMNSDQLKASLASLTKIARRDGNSARRPADWVTNGDWAVWEVDPGLRKVIEDHNLLP